MPAELALGAAQLGMDYGVANRRGKMAQPEALEFLDQIFQAGIGTIDTSPAYGDSEALIGAFILTHGPVLRVVTKLPTMPPGLTPAGLRSLVENRLRSSLLALNLTRADDYLIHAEGDFHSYGKELVDAMEACREAGLAGRVGLSVYTPEAALQAMDLGMQVLQVPCNVLDRRFDRAGVFARAQAQGVKIYARSIYLQGLLLLEPSQVGGWLPQGEGFLRRFHEFARQRDRSLEEVAFVYIRDKIGIDSMVIGMETPEQIHSNLRLRNARPLDTDDLAILEALFQHVPEEVVNPSLWRRA